MNFLNFCSSDDDNRRVRGTQCIDLVEGYRDRRNCKNRKNRRNRRDHKSYRSFHVRGFSKQKHGTGNASNGSSAVNSNSTHPSHYK